MQSNYSEVTATATIMLPLVISPLQLKGTIHSKPLAHTDCQILWPIIIIIIIFIIITVVMVTKNASVLISNQWWTSATYSNITYSLHVTGNRNYFIWHYNYRHTHVESETSISVNNDIPKCTSIMFIYFFQSIISKIPKWSRTTYNNTVRHLMTVALRTLRDDTTDWFIELSSTTQIS